MALSYQKQYAINSRNVAYTRTSEIGKRTLQLTTAFDVHPAVIMFPEYESKEIQKTA